jgi:hypothetical protein
LQRHPRDRQCGTDSGESKMTTTEIRPLMPPETAAEIAKAGAKAGDNEAFQAFGEDGFTFADFIDIINPLQHIPVVATIYRAMTGDDIDPGSRVAGGALFGGPVGAVAATFNAFLDETTGKDVGEHVLAFFDGGEPQQAPLTVASTPGNGAGAGLPDLGMLAPLPAAAIAPEPKLTVTRPRAPIDRAPIELSALSPLSPAASSLAVLDLGALPTFDDGPADEQEEPNAQPQAQPGGAVAPEGGWFTETMLSALQKYETSARLVEANIAQPAPSATY